jgi:Family of unknown function (DUF5681)
MTSSKPPFEVGHKKPPKRTQWKPGQCGNPKRQYERASKGSVQLIDEAFARTIKITENDERRSISVFVAIVLQLLRKEMGGDRRAMTVRLKYQEFAEKRAGRRKQNIRIEYERGTPAPFGNLPDDDV